MTASAATLRHTTFIVSTLAMLPHVFCCGIPAVVALISLGTTLGLGAAMAGNPFYAFVDAYHLPLLGLAIASVVISGILNFIAYRIDCRMAAASACTHGDCTPRKRHSLRLFAASLALLALDIAWFSAEEYVLGLHHHAEPFTLEATPHTH